MICRKTSITACAFVMTAALMLLLLTGDAGAVPVEEWNKSYGFQDDYVLHFVQTSDDGYLLLTAMNKLIKTSSNGSELWNKDSRHEDYGFNTISRTSDDGYILFGNKFIYGEEHVNISILKIDANGDKQWEKTFGNTLQPFFIQQTSDGGYIIAGAIRSFGSGEHVYALLIKTDSNGNKQWDKVFGEESSDYVFNYVQKTSDNGYIIAGQGGKDAMPPLLIKTDSQGNEQWRKTLSTETEYRGICCVLQTSDNGYIAAGSLDLAPSIWKVDANGNEQWTKKLTLDSTSLQKKYEISDEKWTLKIIGYAVSLQQTPDGVYVVAGNSYLRQSKGSYEIIMEDSLQEGWVIKTDARGNEKWSKVFSNPDVYVRISSMQLTQDGGIALAGNNKLRPWLVKLRGAGAVSNPSKDIAPDINKPAEKSTPGFEMLGTIISVAMILLLKRKRA